MPFVFSGEDRKKKSGVFRRPASIEKKDSKVMNIFKNLAAPFSSGKAIKGSISYVALEVLVSKLLRKIMQMDNKSWTELSVVHALTLPILGGVGAAFNGDDNRPTRGYGAKKMATHVKEGAKTVPALFTAQYVYNTYCHGLGLHFWSVKDALVMATAKILTRPIASKLYRKSKFFQNAFDAVQLMHESQALQSNLRRSTAIKSRYDVARAEDS